MIELVRIERTDYCDVISHACQMRQDFGHLLPALAVLGEPMRRAEQLRHTFDEGKLLTLIKRFRARLPA